jgi:hypothetical protein
MLVTLFTLNVLTVKAFGEVEFWFAIIKIIAVLALIAVSLVLIATAFVSPTGVTASLSHLVQPEAAFPYGLSGFFAGFQIAIFSFAGTELIGTTAAETRDPRRSLPKAINAIPVRIILFYVVALACIIAVTRGPRSRPTAARSSSCSCWPVPGGGGHRQLRGADLGRLVGQQRRVLHQPHAVRPGRAQPGARRVRRCRATACRWPAWASRAC